MYVSTNSLDSCSIYGVNSNTVDVHRAFSVSNKIHFESLD